MRNIFLLTLCLLMHLCALAQNVLVPNKLVIFRDGAQLNLKGNLKFEGQKARMRTLFSFVPGTLEAGKSKEYEVRYVKLCSDTLSEWTPAQTWHEVLMANQGRIATVGYDLGNEFDEVTGELQGIDQQGGIFSLRTGSGKQFFIPVDRVRHIMVDTGGISRSEKKTAVPALEISINKDLQFVPIDVTGVIQDISWNPACRLRMLDDKVARYQLSTQILNHSADLPEMDIELSPNNILKAGESSTGAKENYKAGKMSLRKGEELMVNLKESQHEYQPVYQCHVPWNESAAGKIPNGLMPVTYLLKFTNALIPSSACPSLAVADENNRVLSVVPLENVPPGGYNELNVYDDTQLRVEFGETEIRRLPKPFKVGDRQLYKAEIEGRIYVVNTKPEAVSLRFIRDIKGNVYENGGGTVEGAELTKEGKLSFIITVRSQQTREIKYKYETYFP